MSGFHAAPDGAGILLSVGNYKHAAPLGLRRFRDACHRPPRLATSERNESVPQPIRNHLRIHDFNVMSFFSNYFNAGPFMPHGHCYFWTPSLIALQVVSD